MNLRVSVPLLLIAMAALVAGFQAAHGEPEAADDRTTPAVDTLEGLVQPEVVVPGTPALAPAQEQVPQAKPGDERVPQMTLGQAAVLGVVEGLTEYLPISSTGHLLLTQRVMGIGNDEPVAGIAHLPTDAEAERERAENERAKSAANAFAICIQAGAIVAVLGIYRRRVVQMIGGVIGDDEAGWRLLVNLIAAFVPAAVIGLLLDDPIELYLFGLWPIVAAWAVGGVAILVVSRRPSWRPSAPGRELVDLSTMHAVVIGLAQCIAMWPGTSRSLVTIMAGVMIGLRLSAAVEFSFLLGVGTLGAATLYKAVQVGPAMVESYGVGPMAVGLVTAWISAVVAVKWMVAYLNRHGLSVFGWYRLGLAAVVAVLLWRGVIAAV